MSKPIIAAVSPKVVNLEIDKKYFYCACGRSANHTFCDGSHKGTEISPIGFIAEQASRAICMCRQSKNAPYCDGSHNKFTADQIGTEG